MPELVEYILSNKVPSNWRPMSALQEVELVELTRHDSEYNGIVLKIKKNTSGSVVRRVVQVQNPYLWGCYQLKKEECVQRISSTKELELWHMTSETSAMSIANDNFDWRRAMRCKFGKGISFSPNAGYASRQSTYKGVQILCKVLVGKELSAGGGSTWANIKIPPEGVDTTTGNDRKVFVKYSDNEFYPAYIVYLEEDTHDNDVESIQNLLDRWRHLQMNSLF